MSCDIPDGKGMPCLSSVSLSCLFSWTAWSFCSVAVVYTSLSRRTSFSRALTYCSFLSRWDLSYYQYAGLQVAKKATNLCAWRFSSCRLVKAGLLSGLGPLFFAGSPSVQEEVLANQNFPVPVPWPTYPYCASLSRTASSRRSETTKQTCRPLHKSPGLET